MRLSAWRRQCKCSLQPKTPKDERVIPYVAQTERLIACSPSLQGVRVSKVHHAWVHMRSSLAVEVIDRWCSWAETLPYDEDGVLCDEWQAHTKIPYGLHRGVSESRAIASKDGYRPLPYELTTQLREWPVVDLNNESEVQLAVFNTRKVETGSKLSKLGWPASEIRRLYSLWLRTRKWSRSEFPPDRLSRFSPMTCFFCSIRQARPLVSLHRLRLLIPFCCCQNTVSNYLPLLG